MDDVTTQRILEHLANEPFLVAATPDEIADLRERGLVVKVKSIAITKKGREFLEGKK